MSSALSKDISEIDRLNGMEFPATYKGIKESPDMNTVTFAKS